MATGTIVSWPAPDEAPLSGLAVADRGAVVTVRIAPQSGAAALGPAPDGTMPRVIYFPDREPDGTGGFQEVDARTLLAGGPLVGPRPRTVVNSSFPDKKHGYAVDIGCPFPCAWAGHFRIGGGAAAGGLPSPQDVEIVIQRPELSGTVLQVVGAQTEAYTRIRYSLLGGRPLRSPACSFRNITTTPVMIPYGAVAVQVPTTAIVRFTDPGGASDDVTIEAGEPFQLGSYQLGTMFALPPTVVAPPPAIVRISFILEMV